MRNIISFKINYKLEDWNTIIGRCRCNKYGANSHKQKEMRDISIFMRNLPKIKEYPIEIVFKWHVKNRGSDLDNKSVKSVLDEMQKLGILENDNIKHINKITHIAISDKEEYLEVEIYESMI